MPGENKKGPMGEGPRTGRGLGRCNNNTETNEANVPDQQNTTRDFGPGTGRGMGRGFGRGPGRGPGRGFGRGPGQGPSRGLGRVGGRGFGRGNR